MFVFKPERIKNVLIVDNNNFFSIVNQDDESYEVEIAYRISQTDIVKLGLSNVKISVFSKNVISPRVRTSLGYNQSFEDSIFLYSNIERKKAEQKNYLLGEHIENISSQVDSSLVGKIMSLPKSEIQEFYKKKIKKIDSESFKDKKNILKVQETNSYLNNTKFSSFKTDYLKIINEEKIDPSSYFNKPKRISGNKIEKLNGLGGVKPFYETSFAVDSFHKNLKFLPQLEKITSTYFEDIFDDFIHFTSKFKIKKSSNFKIILNLFKANSDIPVDIQQYFESISEKSLIQKPISIAPDVSYGNGHINIVQKDIFANQVLVFVKNIGDEKYSFFSLKNLRLNESAQVKTRDSEFDTIYRVIPKNDDGLSSVYTSQIVLSEKKSSIKKIKIFASTAQDGSVNIEIQNLPDDAISVQFLYRETTSGLSQRFEKLNKLIILSGSTPRGSIQTNVSSLRSFSTYEFSAKISYLKGGHEILGNFSLFYVDKKLIDINEKSIQAVDIIAGQDISFRINSVVDNKKFDLVRDALNKNEALSSFQADLDNERGKKKNLLFYEITRIDLLSGGQDFLGVFSEENFSDLSASSKSGVIPASQDKDYKYKISLLSANPESVFHDFKKEQKNKRSKKLYTYQPFKYENNFTKTTGSFPILRSKNLDVFRTGIETEVIIRRERRTNSIRSFSSQVLNKKFIKLLFFIDGNIERYDHLIVSKILNDEKFQIASLHSQNPLMDSFLYQLLPSDIGSIKFSIIPVYWDFTVGEEIFSNEFFLEN